MPVKRKASKVLTNTSAESTKSSDSSVGSRRNKRLKRETKDMTTSRSSGVAIADSNGSIESQIADVKQSIDGQKDTKAELPLSELSILEKWIRTEVDRRVAKRESALRELSNCIMLVKHERTRDHSVYLCRKESEANDDLINHQTDVINAELYENRWTMAKLYDALPQYIMYFQSMTRKQYHAEAPDGDDPVVQLNSRSIIPLDILSDIERHLCNGVSFIQKHIHVVPAAIDT